MNILKMKHPISARVRKIFVAGIFTAFLSPVFYGCGSDEGNEETDGIDTSATSETEVKTTERVRNIFYSVPSPIELAQLIQRAGAKYNKDLLNDPKNISKYNTNTTKALNLGIYGADLAYTSVFENNTQECILYLACTRKLAESLGVGNAFDEKVVDRINANTDKKDSLLTIISESYTTTDEILKESQRESTSALVITGGFIEALYLGTQLAEATKNNTEIINRIAEQKSTLDNVVMLLTAYKNDANVAAVLTDVKQLKEIYDEIKTESKSSAEVKTNPTTKVTTIGGKITYIVTPEIMEKLTVKTSEIRNKIISGQN